MKRRPQSAVLYKLGNPAKSEPSIPDARSRDSISRLMFTNKPQKTVSPPNQYFADQETLYFQNIHLQQEANEVRYQNVKLKTTISQLQKRIQQIEKVDKYQTNVDPLGMCGSNEGSIIPMLKAKIREQSETISTLEEDLKRQCKSVKLTQLVELQKEIKNQQDEILRLRQQQQVALRLTDQDIFQDPNINERIKNYVMILNAMENQIDVLQKQNDQLKMEYQELVDDNIKTKEEIKQISFEKTQLKKKLEDQVITETEQYQAKKREFLEKKLQSILKQVDSLKGELSLYENKYKLGVKQLKDQEREYKQTIVQTQKARQNLEEILIKKEQLIQDLQDRVAIQDLLKQKSATPVVETPEVKQIIPPKTYRTQYTQFPEVQQEEHKATDIINTTPLDKNELQSILEDLRYKVIQMGLTKQRLTYIFRGTQYIQLKQAIKLFMKQPFNYSEYQSIMICRYFIGEDQGQSYRIQWEDTQSIDNLIQLIIPSNEDIKFTFKSIVNRNTLIRQINSQMRYVKMENKIFNVDDYIIYLKRNSKLTDEQISLMRMINQQYLGDSQNIDQTFIQLYLKEEYEMLGQLSKLQKTDFTIYRQIPKLQVKLSYDYEDYPKMQIQTKTVTEETYLPSKEIEPVLTLSQIRQKDQTLRSSENRKPTSKDTLVYSNSFVESVPIVLKRPIDLKQSQGPFPNLTESIPQLIHQDNEFEMGGSLMKPPSLLKNHQEEDEYIQEENEFNSENEVQMCEEL